tara:strand:+ start:141 stop:833 length:693 start_codon:yes stop_codon:yes gene_type:complete
MKKILLFIFLACNFVVAQQNITFEQVGLKVEAGSEGYVLDLVDGFYSSINLPDGVSVILDYVAFKSHEIEATHYLSFVGSVEGLTELRKMRSGADYSEYISEMQKFGSITSSNAGSTLIRTGLNKRNGHTYSQTWQWRVDNPAVFAAAFQALMKGYSHPGYVSLGQISHGQSSDGESHYVYASHKDYGAALTNNIDTKKEQEAFAKFQQTIAPISTYFGSRTLMNIKTWN